MTIIEGKKGLARIIILDPGEQLRDDDKFITPYIFGRTIKGELESVKMKFPVVNYPNKFKST